MRSTFHQLFHTMFISLSVLIIVQLNWMTQEVNAHLGVNNPEMSHAYQSIGMGIIQSVEISSQNIRSSQNHLRYEAAILERFEDHERAVFLFEELQEEVIIPIQILPTNAQVNTWFDVWIDLDGQIIFSLNKIKTKEKRDQARKIKKQLETK